MIAYQYTNCTSLKKIPSIYRQPTKFPPEPAYEIMQDPPRVQKDVHREVAFIKVLIRRHRYNMVHGNSTDFDVEVTKFLRLIQDQAYSEGLKHMDMMHAKIDNLIEIDYHGKNQLPPSDQPNGRPKTDGPDKQA